MAGLKQILWAGADLFVDQRRDAINAAGDGSEWVGDALPLIIEKGASNPLRCQRMVMGNRISLFNLESTHGPFEVSIGLLCPYECKTSFFPAEPFKTLLDIRRFYGKEAEHGVAAIRATMTALHQRAIPGTHAFKGLVGLAGQELISLEEIVDDRHQCDAPAYERPSVGPEISSGFLRPSL